MEPKQINVGKQSKPTLGALINRQIFYNDVIDAYDEIWVENKLLYHRDNPIFDMSD